MCERYTEADLVRIAQRENNTRRPYLVVNRLQAKHIPAEPVPTIRMFDALAGVLAAQYERERLLIVGFAETATAIGARLAIRLDSYYMQTTREEIDGASYFYFTESHSHATEQKLVKTELDKIIPEIDRIVFAEDEITTGNTILKIIRLIRQEYPDQVRFSAASLLNGMDEEAGHTYQAENIPIHYLVKTDHRHYSETADGFRGDGVYASELKERPMPEVKRIRASHYLNARLLVRGADYDRACRALWGQIAAEIAFAASERVLVMGTEEFMYPAIYAAYQCSRAGCLVKCHSTTRSPIAVSTEPDYPLRRRYELRSFYDSGRTTYVYDIDCYDKVLVITDAAGDAEAGIHDLCCALAAEGNADIYVVRW